MSSMVRCSQRGRALSFGAGGGIWLVQRTWGERRGQWRGMLPYNRAMAVAPAAHGSALARRLGLFDVTMLVMGGIIGSGIFMNPYVVARQVHTPALILAAWIVGGVVALLGAFVYAELAAALPDVGGQYAYLREAFHPGVAFVYGWALLLVTQTGGMAAVAVTFARYFLELTDARVPEAAVAVAVLMGLTAINCFGVKAGSNVQSALMITKLAAIAALVVFGYALVRPADWRGPLLDQPLSPSLLLAFGAAMTPVLFAYGGWQTATFVGGEIRDPRRTLPRGLLLGVLGVIVAYVLVNVVCVRALGADGLAQTTTPASAVMRLALGARGAAIIALGIAVSTAGFLSQGMLTAPRVYFAMAQDGVFFRWLTYVHPRTRVPVAAIVLQGVWASVIALTGRYEQILNYVVSTDFILFGLTGTCVFVFRRRGMEGAYRVPWHPWTTLTFVAVCWVVVLVTVFRYPANSLIGWAIMLAGIPVYFLWSRRRRA